MNRAILYGTLFLLFLLEGTLFQVFSPGIWGSTFVIIPNLTLCVIIMVALYLGRVEGLWIGFAFGLLHDVVYGDVIGVYAFSMAFIGYFTGQLNQLFNQNILLLLVTIIFADLFFLTTIYGLFYLFGLTTASFEWTMFYHIFPSVMFNLAFSVLVYQPIRHLLSRMNNRMEEAE